MIRLYDALAAYAENGRVPMHMPGHKRGEYDYLVGAEMDITEIDGFDNLHDAEGLLRQSMEHAAAVWGSAHSSFSVNGSTGAILAAIHAAAAAGRSEEIIVARNCHKSVYHAIELCRLKPIWITPPVIEGTSLFGSLPPDAAEAALAAHPNACLLVLTSPTYEGVVSDIAAITAAAHRRGVPVLVDEAHGAHLGFGGGFPDGAVHAGADIVVQSLHKTLPSLTQTAIAHVQGHIIDYAAFLRSKNIFETSSPSYLLMASCDGCAYLLGEDRAVIDAWGEMLTDFRAQTARLEKLRVLSPTDDPAVFAYDPSKLVISTRQASISASELAAVLREAHGIELEMVSGDYGLAMTGLGTKKKHLDRLAEALLSIDAALSRVDASILPFFLPPPPEQAMLPYAAVAQKKEILPLGMSEGRIAGGYLWAYPPGIPLIAPGQPITSAVIAAVAELRAQGIGMRDEIEVIKE